MAVAAVMPLADPGRGSALRASRGIKLVDVVLRVDWVREIGSRPGAAAITGRRKPRVA
jgi:hypothetical protein